MRDIGIILNRRLSHISGFPAVDRVVSNKETQCGTKRSSRLHARVVQYELEALGPDARAEIVALRRESDATVRGIVRWAEPGQKADQPLNRKLLHLVGLKNTATHGLRYNVRSDENGRYEFTNIVAGPYKLTDAIAGEPMWRLKITVPQAQETAVDLDTQNSAKVRDDFRERGPS